MRKQWLILSVLFLAALFMGSCASSIDRDAKKVAELFCQMYDLIEEENWEALEAMQAELDAFDEELESKYDFDDEDVEKEFEDAVAKALERLDCGLTIDDLR